MKANIYEIIGLIIIDAFIFNYVLDWIFNYNIIYHIVGLFVENYTVTYAYVIFFINCIVIGLIIIGLFYLVKMIKRK